MNTFKDILAVCIGAVPFVISTVTFLIKFIKNKKVKAGLQKTLQLMEAIQPLIIQAEEFVHYTGSEKKQFVMTQAHQFAIDHGMSFDREEFSQRIDELVATTKKVNARAKDLATAVPHTTASAGPAVSVTQTTI